MSDHGRDDHPHRDGAARSARPFILGQGDDERAADGPSADVGSGQIPGSNGEGPPGPRREGACQEGACQESATAQGRGRSRGGARRARRPSRRRKILRWTAVGAILVLIAAGTMVYLRLNGNLQIAPLDLGVASQGGERVDPFGRTPLNILLIGSDTRSSSADCRIGGDCGPGQNADVEMVVHLSADRTNATVMSIPRDTIVNVPQCAGPSGHVYPAQQAVQITSSLQDGGPGCTVAAVHALTGITIDHFVMIDFVGVVNMADDVGGVPVCVSANVFDPDSHLRLTKGTHVIVGLQALEFLRTRHGFLYGGDLYRTQAQHMYLSALIRKMKSTTTLTNPVTLYRLANDATKAITVDPGLDGIPKLVGLTRDLNKVPTKRITFVTMPTVPYPGNPAAWLSPAMPAAQQLFNDMITDAPLTHADSAARPAVTPSPATASPTPAVGKAAAPVSLENGTGLAGRAHDIAVTLASDGFFSQSAGSANAPYTITTSLTYGPGERAQAQAVAKALGLPARTMHRSGSSVTLMIGADWPSGTTYPGSNPSASPNAPPGPSAAAGASSATGSATPPPGSSPENASGGSECAQVNPAYSF